MRFLRRRHAQKVSGMLGQHAELGGLSFLIGMSCSSTSYGGGCVQEQWKRSRPGYQPYSGHFGAAMRKR